MEDKQITDTLRHQLQIIYDAYDRLYAIPGHRWHAFGYYYFETHQSDLFGHYVRSLDQFVDREPLMITLQDYIDHSQPLIHAIDDVLLTILISDPDGADIISISKGLSLIFRHRNSRDRCIAVLQLIEKVYPRATYRDGAKPKAKPRKQKKTSRLTTHDSRSTPYSKPTPTIRWTPYKED